MNDFSFLLIALIVLVALFEAGLKIIAMWKSARNGHKVWFICIAIINTAGILPLIYILKNKKAKQEV